jgi:hypothetical protein
VREGRKSVRHLSKPSIGPRSSVPAREPVSFLTFIARRQGRGQIDLLGLTAVFEKSNLPSEAVCNDIVGPMFYFSLVDHVT